MGRRDKHRSGSSRNNPVFKVVGARVGRAAKGRPRGVDVKLKKLNGEKLKTDVARLDAQLVTFQHRSVQNKKKGEGGGELQKKKKGRPGGAALDVNSFAKDFAEKATATTQGTK